MYLTFFLRYDLHEWLFTLHNALENFKKKVEKQRRQQQQQQQQQQDEDVDADQMPSTAQKLSATAGRTPPNRRPAPLPPKNKGGGATASDSPRRKPVRPAPIAPGGKRRMTFNGRMPASNEVANTPPPQYFSTLPSVGLSPGRPRSYQEHRLPNEGHGTLESNQSGFSTMESGQHIIDLDIAEIEREQSVSVNEEAQSTSIHTRSSSDSLVLMQTQSLNDIVSQDSVSPENGEGDYQQKGVEAHHSTKTSSHSYGHTRHLSLMESLEIKESHGSRKKKPRRTNSVKGRSRSPPNLPPPPPPPESGSKVEGKRSFEASQEEPDDNGVQQLLPNEGLTHSTTSSSSLGFSEVLNTISNIDQQLETITDNFSDPQTMQVEMARISFTNSNFAPSPIPEELNKEFNEEWIHEVPDNQIISPPLVSPGQSIKTSPNIISPPLESPGQSIKTPPNLVIPSPSTQFGLPNGGEWTRVKNAASETPTKVKHRVMFKDEVEDIPNSYEPRIDQEDVVTPPPDEEPLVGVAAIKAKLFGKQEKNVTRYRKEGLLSPRHTHPTNLTFSDDYFSKQMTANTYRDSSPNINNNNSEKKPLVSYNPVMNGDHISTGEMTEDKKNPYNSPQDQNSVSKYKLIGIRRNIASPKENTPPPLSPKKIGAQIKYAEVYTKETPRPTATEVRSVNSLEKKEQRPRSKSSSITSPTSPTKSSESLLASISNTLQVTSRYGSDSFLSTEGSGSSSWGKENMKMSSRGELEKIRAAHRRDTTPTRNTLPHPYPLTNATKPIQHSSPHLFSTPTTTNFSSLPRGLASGISEFHGLGKSPQMAASLDVLSSVRSDTYDRLPGRSSGTHVTYDKQTHAHVFRSLV